MKELIMVGATTQNNTLVNGQSMMFQLIVDKLEEKGISTKVVDFGKSIDPDFHKKRVSGKFNFTKLIDNFLLIFQFIWVMMTTSKLTLVYINTAQSKVGFLRDYIFIRVAYLFGKKVIAHQFGANYSKFYSSQSQKVQEMIKNTFRKVECIIVEGDFTKQQFSFLPNYHNKVISIPNGLPEKIDMAAMIPKQIKKEEPVKLFYLSNLIEGKGYWDVLEAINILVNEYSQNVTAVFAGRILEDGEDEMFKSAREAKKSFFNFIKTNRLEGKVTYTEGLYGYEKARQFSENHFFLLPSYYINEGQPVSVLEALAYGCVPIVTNYRLIPAMVNADNGFFVEPKSPVQIADAVRNMINDPDEYHKKSREAISFYKKNFTADKYVEKLVNLFLKHATSNRMT